MFDWDREFGRRARRVLDIGCGDGRYLLDSAAARPDCDHLGIELLAPLLAKGRKEASKRGHPNLRFVAGDAVDWLRRRLEAGSVDEVHVYHPQPYHDPAQAGLGMLTEDFFERVWRVLAPGGLLVLQTDSRPLGKYLLEACRSRFEPEVLAGPWPGAPGGRTTREVLAIRKKLAVTRIAARRRDRPIEVPFPPDYFAPGRPGLRTVRSASKRKRLTR